MKEITQYDIDEVLKESIWGLSNRVLYKMCENEPYHNLPNVIASKFLIIGRTYAAAIERRKINTGYSSEEFYEKVLIPEIKKHSDEIDEGINMLQEYEYIDINNIDKALLLHGQLMEILYNVSGQNKRSLTSKYLHFHVPNMFFIFDSRAMSALRKHGFTNKPVQIEFEDLPIDDEYMKFSVGMLKMQTYIEEKFKMRLNPRQLDRLLLKI